MVTELVSYDRHDYKTHLDANGEEYMVDGGTNYLRRNKCKEEYTETSLYSDTEHEVIRNVFTWGTYGINGDQPLRQILLNNMDTAHIKAILKTQTRLPKHTKQLFKDELDYRDK